MENFFKKALIFSLLILSLSGFYHLVYEGLLLKETNAEINWIKRALEKVSFSKFDPSVFQNDHEIQLLSGQEKEKTLEFLKIDINQASLEELISLPRIGPAIAKRIVESRSLSGPFSKLEDLGRVKGLGPKSLEILREWIRFSNAVSLHRTSRHESIHNNERLSSSSEGSV
jgi:competence ComEA-like helix-hairpin-helix protein